MLRTTQGCSAGSGGASPVAPLVAAERYICCIWCIELRLRLLRRTLEWPRGAAPVPAERFLLLRWRRQSATSVAYGVFWFRTPPAATSKPPILGFGVTSKPQTPRFGVTRYQQTPNPWNWGYSKPQTQRFGVTRYQQTPNPWVWGYQQAPNPKVGSYTLPANLQSLGLGLPANLKSEP